MSSARTVRFTETALLPTLPAASRANTVIVFVPPISPTLVMLQLVVPLAVPLAPLLLDQVTCVTPTLSVLVPEREIGDVVNVEPEVGETMLTDGGAVSAVGAPVVIVQLNACDVVSTPSDTFAVTEKVPAVVPAPEMNPVLEPNVSPGGRLVAE